MVTYSTDLFLWKSDTKTFLADITDIEYVGRINLKEGFNLKSTKTGTVLKMNFERTICDYDGDIIAWLFRPHRGDFSVRILND